MILQDESEQKYLALFLRHSKYFSMSQQTPYPNFSIQSLKVHLSKSDASFSHVIRNPNSCSSNPLIQISFQLSVKLNFEQT